MRSAPGGSCSSPRPAGSRRPTVSGWSASWVARWPPRSTVSAATCPPTSSRPHSCRPARDAIDAVVSFGGGSAMDLGKAIVFFTEQEAGAPGTTYLDRPALPHVAIPTTYSGAEITMFFGMTDERTRTKGGGGGPTTAPVAVVYDPELTVGTPVQVTAETSLNALAHCVEAAYAVQRSPEAEAVALAGARAIHDALPRVVDDPEQPRGPHRPAGRRRAGRPGAPERHDGGAPRPVAAARRADRHPPRPGQRPRAAACDAVQRAGGARGHGGDRRTRSAAGRRRLRSRCCASVPGSRRACATSA